MVLDTRVQERWAATLALDGSFVAECDGQIVGTLGAYTFRVSTPGGAPLPALGMTLASVLPTHRRRGILSRLLRTQIAWAQSQGCAVAGLWASETPIYRRFGFGIATYQGQWRVACREAGVHSVDNLDRIILIDTDDAEPRVQAIYERRWQDRAWTLSRSGPWWKTRRFFDDPLRRGSATNYIYAVAVRAGEDVGYLQYRRHSRWEAGLPKDELYVEELVGDCQARSSLLHFALTTDLVREVTFFSLPIDDPLPWVLVDRRHAQLVALDGVWARLLDIPAVLRNRRYGADGALTLGIRCPGAAHRTLRLEVHHGIGQCTASSGPPDVELSLSELSSVIWNGVPTRTLADAGLIQGPAEAIAQLGRMVWTDQLPHCPERF